jgi:choline-sulfatase
MVPPPPQPPPSSGNRRLRELATHVAAAPVSSVVGVGARTTARRPNILVIVTDQQSHALLSCADSAQAGWLATPSCDRLAAEGTRFTRAYCSNPVCVPSRFSLFTGRMPSAIGMRDNASVCSGWDGGKHDRTGLGHQLGSQAGYDCFYGGKVHWPVGLTPERLGFIMFCTDERERLAVETAHLIRRLGSSRHHAPWLIVSSLINPHDICYHALRAHAHSGGGADPTVGGIFSREPGAAQIQELVNLDEALAAAANTGAKLPPLPPNHAPQRDEPEQLGRFLDERPFQRWARDSTDWGEEHWRLHRWAYARLMERVDRQIGVLLDALDATAQTSETLVIMTSDHGDHDASHALEHKTIFYEEAARVPWIMRLPGRIPAGVTNQRCLVSTGLDLTATCCDYAGLPTPPHCLGISLRQVAEDPSHPSTRNHVYAGTCDPSMQCG